MLTPSVNLVQSAFPENKQGEISGLSRAVSNLGSSFGTAIAGTILVSNLVSGNGTYVAAMIVLVVVALAGLAVSFLLPASSGTSLPALRQPARWTQRSDSCSADCRDRPAARCRGNEDRRQRPGSRIVISWSSQPLPSGSLNVAKEP